MGVIALNQAAAGRVVVGDGQQQGGALREGELRLHQTLSKSGFAQQPGPVVILQGARHDFGRGSRPAVHQDDDGIALRGGLRLGAENLLLLRAPPVAHHHLPIVQISPRQGHGFVDQAAGIAAKIQYHAGDGLLSQLLEQCLHVAADVLRFERGDVQIGSARPQPEGIHHAGLDLSAGYRHGDGLAGAFPPHGDTHLAALWPSEQIGYRARVHAGGVMPVHGGNGVAAAQIGFPRGRTGEGFHHHNLSAFRANQHSHAEILRMLFPLHVAELGGVEEARMRVQGVQHARNGALIDGRSGEIGSAKFFSTSA